MRFRLLSFAILLLPVPAAAAPLKLAELFQSQGCSSCPPANAALNAIADRPDVIALSYAVTCWDQLGWPDKFARPAFTARQRDCAAAMRAADVYAPQLAEAKVTEVAAVGQR